MPRLRRMFVDGLAGRVTRMRQGLDGVATDVAAGRPPSSDDVEALFLAAHSLKGTAPGFDAIDLGMRAGTLADEARDWSPDTPPDGTSIGRARELLQQIADDCEAIRARADDETPGGGGLVAS